jgi:hypothetical protein
MNLLSVKRFDKNARTCGVVEAQIKSLQKDEDVLALEAISIH